MGGADNLTTPKSSYNTHVSAGSLDGGKEIGEQDTEKRFRPDSSSIRTILEKFPNGQTCLSRPLNYLAKTYKKSAYIYGSQCLPYAKPAPFTYYTKQTRTREIHLIFSFINRTNVHNICVTEGKRALLLLKLKESQSHDGPYLSVCV